MSKVTAKVDLAKLERSIKKYAAKLGETNAQAVIRWSVQTCLDIAKFNKPLKGNLSIHRKSILKDANNCLIPVKGKRPMGSNALKTTGEINQWIESNRTKRGKRVAKLPINQRRKCSETVLKKLVTEKLKRAGLARGAWIGAGNAIGKYQTGSNKISIGVNRFKYAQKHNSQGNARPPSNGFNPIAIMRNNVRYSGDSYVLTNAETKLAINNSRSNTLRFYRARLRALNNKKP